MKRSCPAYRLGNMTKKLKRRCLPVSVITVARVLAEAPVLAVLAVRFIDPPVTPLMLIRWAQSAFSDYQTVPIRYCWRNLEEMPDHFLTAVLVIEDQRFFDHHGFDWTELRKALAESKAQGKPVRGASTISMQCARSLFLWQSRSWVRKGLEAYYTVLMELLLPKRRILELYVNVIELGDGVYGLEAAAQHHYGVSAGHLTEAQSSMLAAVVTHPRVWNPRKPMEWARVRQQVVQRRVAQAPSLARKLQERVAPWAVTKQPEYDSWGPLWIST